jgi:hypothetical protein
VTDWNAAGSSHAENGRERQPPDVPAEAQEKAWLMRALALKPIDR